MKTHQDVAMIEQLCKEQDGLLQTVERLHSVHNMARE
jgi:hypothetical protein